MCCFASYFKNDNYLHNRSFIIDCPFDFKRIIIYPYIKDLLWSVLINKKLKIEGFVGEKMEILTKIAPNSTFAFVVPEDYEKGIRIDRFIAQQFPLYSRNFFQQLIDDKLIMLNGRIVSKQSAIVKPADTLTVTFPPERIIDQEVVSSMIADKQLNVELIAEHEHFFIVYKPAHLLVHSPSARSKAITLVDWLLVNYKELAHVGHTDRPAIIHRLDKDTSGLLIIPRTPYAHATFGRMFRNREVIKVYHALVKGSPPAHGSIDLAIGRDPHNKKKMAAFLMPGQTLEPVVNRGMQSYCHEGLTHPSQLGPKKIRGALTHYRVLEYFADCALVEVKLVTGRMHQIRVHFSAIGYPLLGDPVYGVKSKLIKRQALHAHTLSFTLEDKNYSFSKEVPNDFLQVLTHLRTA